MSRIVKCSYMNDTKWQAVLSTLGAHGVASRIKLLYYDYVDVEGPGEDAIASCSPDRHYYPEYQVMIQKSPKYWDGPSIGPFKTIDIEWLALPSVTFAKIRDELPTNLEVVQVRDESIVLGYGF
jgi:hypothetical protein